MCSSGVLKSHVESSVCVCEFRLIKIGTQPICVEGLGLTFKICLTSLGNLWVVTNWAGSKSRIPNWRCYSFWLYLV